MQYLAGLGLSLKIRCGLNIFAHIILFIVRFALQSLLRLSSISSSEF